MCGRYALALPPWRVREYLDDSNMPSQEPPDDGDVRQSYNFSPGYYGLVYRADVPDQGAGGSSQSRAAAGTDQDQARDNDNGDNDNEDQAVNASDSPQEPTPTSTKQPQYKLQAMKWGLIPFWTKRNPDYGTLMKTINCRDDSLASPGGMWHTMKQKKRCIVIAQGFFEWLKKNEGKDKIPHYIRRKDGQLMCFAGLWDCVKYEGHEEKTYTYTIITTDSNKQISFLHDRMPVIFDCGSPEIFTWLDSNRSEWNRELQALLKPFKGELEIYPVTKDMNKTGSSSPAYIVPIDSAENKQNIANFFSKSKEPPKTPEKKKSILDSDKTPKSITLSDKILADTNVEAEATNRETNAPLPVAGRKREFAEVKQEDEDVASTEIEKQISTISKSQKVDPKQSSPSKKQTPISSKRSKSATSNATVSKASPVKTADGNKRITSFFGK